MVNDVLNISSDKIIYVSCNPITMGRDINLLKEKYMVEKIYLLDMFSNTFHFESVCVLKKSLNYNLLTKCLLQFRCIN